MLTNKGVGDNIPRTYPQKGCVSLIVKPRDYPTEVVQMEALNRRTPANHPQKERITLQARNLRTGYKGEQSLDFILNFLPEKKYRIFHNLRLKDRYGFFQIDTLLISTTFALILEVKNIHGTITFDQLGQTIRTRDDGTEQRFNNPIDQVNLQAFRFRKWLKRNQTPHFPLEKLIVYSNSHTILRNTENCEHISRSILHKEQLLTKIEKFNDQYQTIILDEFDLMTLSSKIVASHNPPDKNVLDVYGVKKNELLTGVICPECEHFFMVYGNKKWHCTVCGYVAKDLHLDALEDYRLLISHKIKNRDARIFLKINSVHTMKRLLMDAKFKYTGKTSARIYYLG